MIRACTALLAAALVGGAAAAQPAAGDASWPSKPIRLIAPFPPGSTADLIGRALGSLRKNREFRVEF